MSSPPAHQYEPDYAVAPGETLRQQLDAINLSQAELASRSGLSAKHVNQIMQGIAPITHETALVLERVTGLPARLWNRLEADYRETLLRKRQQELSAEDEAWLEDAALQGVAATGSHSRDQRQFAALRNLARIFRRRRSRGLGTCLVASRRVI